LMAHRCSPNLSVVRTAERLPHFLRL
jgi:hypothetical protein